MATSLNSCIRLLGPTRSVACCPGGVKSRQPTLRLQMQTSQLKAAMIPASFSAPKPIYPVHACGIFLNPVANLLHPTPAAFVGLASCDVRTCEPHARRKFVRQISHVRSLWSVPHADPKTCDGSARGETRCCREVGTFTMQLSYAYRDL